VRLEVQDWFEMEPQTWLLMGPTPDELSLVSSTMAAMLPDVFAVPVADESKQPSLVLRFLSHDDQPISAVLTTQPK